MINHSLVTYSSIQKRTINQGRLQASHSPTHKYRLTSEGRALGWRWARHCGRCGEVRLTLPLARAVHSARQPTSRAVRGAADARPRRRCPQSGAPVSALCDLLGLDTGRSSAFMGAELSICRPSALVEATVLTPTRASAPFTRFQVVLGSLTSVRLVRRWGRLSTLYRQCCPKLGSQAPWR